LIKAHIIPKGFFDRIQTDKPTLLVNEVDLSIPVENSPLCRSKSSPPGGDEGLQFQPAG
jgi:hypothetical protein